MRELSNFRFFWRAIWKDIRQSRNWKIVSFAYISIGVIQFILWFITDWTPAQLIAPSSWKGRAIFLLGFTCVGLALALIAVVDGARRLYQEAAANFDQQLENTTADLESRAKRMEKLSEVYGGLHELLKQDRRDEHWPTVAALKYWAERLNKALWDCYSAAGTDRFSRGGAYTLEVPEATTEQNDWLYKTWQRVGDLIKEERPQSERISFNIPDDAYRS